MAKELIKSSALKYWISGIAFAVLLFLSYEKLSFYVRFDFNFILLILALPFVLNRDSKEKSIRYGISAIAFLLLYSLINLSSLFFLAFICSLFFLYEGLFGKLNILPLFLVVIASPIVIFISEMLGFEIRLYLTKLAALSLNLINNNYKSIGNIIVVKDKEFHVDPVCMGLKMVILSFYSTLILISYFQKKYNLKFKIISIIAALSITYLLVIISNFFRIILITLLSIESDSNVHGLIGILCFIVYVILPLLFILKKLPVIKEKTANIEIFRKFHNTSYFIVILLITGLMLYLKITPEKKSNANVLKINDNELNSEKYKFTIEELNVIKLSGKNLLIYIKPATGFYSAEHSPVICWKGCGYKIEKEQIISLNGQDVYFSELHLNNEILFSCWWYDCGDNKTISQFTWRSKSLFNNKKYHLINLVSNQKNIVLEESKKMLKKNLFDEKSVLKYYK